MFQVSIHLHPYYPWQNECLMIMMIKFCKQNTAMLIVLRDTTPKEL